MHFSKLFSAILRPSASTNTLSLNNKIYELKYHTYLYCVFKTKQVYTTPPQAL